MICRLCTRAQFLLNGVIIRKSQLHFFEDDIAKLQAIIQEKPDLVFDDKTSIIQQLQKNKIPVVCVRGLHNTDVVETYNTNILVNDYQNISEGLIKKVLDHSNFGDFTTQQ